MVSLISLAMASIVIANAFASPLLVDVTTDGVFAVATIGGHARARIDGQPVVLPANLQIRLRIADVSDNWIAFKVLSGTIQVGGRVFHIESESWRGLYNRGRHTAIYEGCGSDAAGHKVYLALRSTDTRQTQQGCFMDVDGIVTGPGGNMWKLDLKAYRVKHN